MATITMANTTRIITNTSGNGRLPDNFLQIVNSKWATLMTIPIIYVAAMMVIGIIGNGLVVYVYGFKWRKSPVACFITTLAVFDLINCFITMPTEIATLVNFFLFDFPVFCKISRFSTFWMNNSSVVLLFAIAIDRFIKIYLPNKKTFDFRKAKWTCILSACIGCAVSWPSLVIYGNKTFRMPPPNGPFVAIQCQVADGMEQTTFPIGYYIYLWVAFLAIALVMIILYGLIGVKIWMQKSKNDKRKSSLKASLRSNNSNSQNNEKEACIIACEKVNNFEKTNSVELSDDVFDESRSGRHEGQNKVEEPLQKVPETLDRTASTSTAKSRLKSMTRSISISKSGLQAGKATLMLFIITMVYILSFLPYLIISILFTIYGPGWYPSLPKSSQVAVVLFGKSYLISNTANAIVYGFSNIKFREECWKLFHNICCFCTKR